MSMMCYNQNMRKILGIVGVFVFVGLANLGCAYADESEFDVSIRPYVEISVPGETNLELTPSPSGTFGSTDITVRTATSNPTGYTLVMSSEKNYLEGSISRINPIDSLDDRTENTFRDRDGDMNKWGVSIGNTNNYNPIASTTQIINSDSSTAGQDSVIYVGAKVNTAIAPDTYSTVISFQAVAKIDDSPAGVIGGDPEQSSPDYNPSNPGNTGWSGHSLGRSYEVYYADVLKKPMYVVDESTSKGYRQIRKNEVDTNIDRYFAIQDMNDQVCNSNVYADSELQVIDLRDAKIYWIAKLRDGHCWMTQNLDLMLSSDRPLKHSDSDIGWGTDKSIMQWTPSNTKKIVVVNNNDGQVEGATSNDNDFQNDDYFKPNSYDVGDWYFNSDRASDRGCSYPYVTGRCPQLFRKKIPFDTNGTHGHVGNYYNWNAATAQTDSSSFTESTIEDISKNPQNSICPAGWRLPTASFDPKEKEGSTDEYSRLYYLYMHDGEEFVENEYNDTIDSWLDGDSGLQVNLLYSPLYFTMTGVIRSYSSNPSNTHIGFYWTSTVNRNVYGSGYSQSNSAYNMIFENVLERSRDQYSRFEAQSVRCIAR